MARPVGSKNKIPQTAKENIQCVFTRLEGTAGMARWAKDRKEAKWGHGRETVMIGEV